MACSTVHSWPTAYPFSSVLELIAGNELPGKKHEEGQWKGRLSCQTKATEDIKNSFPFSHCLMGNLCHVLLPARLSVHVVHVVPWQNREPWAIYPVWARELHLVNVLPAKKSKLWSPSTDNTHCLQGVWSFPHKGQQIMLFPPEEDRRIINFLSVWFTWRHLKDILGSPPSFLSVLLDLRACLCILPVAFLTGIFLSCDSYLWRGKKCTICLASLKPKHILNTSVFLWETLRFLKVHVCTWLFLEYSYIIFHKQIKVTVPIPNQPNVIYLCKSNTKPVLSYPSLPEGRHYPRSDFSVSPPSIFLSESTSYRIKQLHLLWYMAKYWCLLGDPRSLGLKQQQPWECFMSLLKEANLQASTAA